MAVRAVSPRSPGTSAHSPAPEAPRRSIAVIGDVVASRRVAPQARRVLQLALERLMASLNEHYRRAIGARFLVTLGDEFQGVLKLATVIPDLVWDVAHRVDARVRLGVGFGMLDPPFKAVALGMDGPAFHAARDAVELARKRKLHGAVFRGFGETDDLVLNGLARLLEEEGERLSPAQWATLDLLRQGRSQAEIAHELHLTRQAVHKRAKGAGWEAFLEGERAWRAALARFDVSTDWGARSR